MSFSVNDSSQFDALNERITKAVSEYLGLTLLVWSTINLSVTFFYWTFLIYSHFLQDLSWKNFFPHFVLFAQFFSSFSNLILITINPFNFLYCISSLSVPFSLTVSYSSLLVRILHLQAPALPSMYQALMLFLLVFFQFSLIAQSLVLTSCYSVPSQLFPLSYSFVLLLSLSLLSSLLRKKREFDGDKKLIFYLSLGFLFLWLTSLSVILIFGTSYRLLQGNYEE